MYLCILRCTVARRSALLARVRRSTGVRGCRQCFSELQSLRETGDCRRRRGQGMKNICQLSPATANSARVQLHRNLEPRHALLSTISIHRSSSSSFVVPQAPAPGQIAAHWPKKILAGVPASDPPGWRQISANQTLHRHEANGLALTTPRANNQFQRCDLHRGHREIPSRFMRLARLSDSPFEASFAPASSRAAELCRRLQAMYCAGD